MPDNGAGFTSHEFRDFVKNNGIKHITSAPYHLSTNSLGCSDHETRVEETQEWFP